MNPSPMILKGNAGISLEFRFVETDDGDGNICYNLTIMQHWENKRVVKNSKVINCNLIPADNLESAIHALAQDLNLYHEDHY